MDRQQYVMQLASVRKDALEAANTRLVIIGCGDWKLIKNYCGELFPGTPLKANARLYRFPARSDRYN